MGAPFSALSFLKKIPSDLLCAYFKRFNKVNLCIFDEKNQKTAILMDFWKELPDEVKKTAESDFSSILEMMNELGVQSIYSIAEQLGCGDELLKPMHLLRPIDS